MTPCGICRRKFPGIGPRDLPRPLFCFGCCQAVEDLVGRAPRSRQAPLRAALIGYATQRRRT